MVFRQPTFGLWDYVVVIIVLLISSSIGIYYRFTGGKQKTMQEYLLADKTMSVTPVAFSLMATFVSAVTLLELSSENYTYGLQFIVINISYIIFTPVAAYLYLPIFFKLQATSAYEYLERRFGKISRLAASLSYTIQMTLYMGIVVYAPALALEALTGINKVIAILSIGLVCTFYSTIGGMKAVLITDVFQSILMFMAVFSVIGRALVETGSFSEIWRIAQEGGRTNLLKIFGLAIYSKYFNCDPVKANYINSADQLMPYYVVDSMGRLPGLSGLFVAGIFSAALSTVSAALNSLAAVTIEDYYKFLYRYIFKRELSKNATAFQAKIIALIYGFICIGLAFLAQFLGGILQAGLTIFGVIGGPLLGLFSLGMFTLTANEAGSVTGLACGIVIGLWMAFSPKPPTLQLPTSIEGCDGLNSSTIETVTTASSDNSDYLWLYRLSYLYNGVMAFIVTFVVGYLLSFVLRKITGKRTEDEVYDPDLFIPSISRKLRKAKAVQTVSDINEKLKRDQLISEPIPSS